MESMETISHPWIHLQCPSTFPYISSIHKSALTIVCSANEPKYFYLLILFLHEMQFSNYEKSSHYMWISSFKFFSQEMHCRNWASDFWLQWRSHPPPPQHTPKITSWTAEVRKCAVEIELQILDYNHSPLPAPPGSQVGLQWSENTLEKLSFRFLTAVTPPTHPPNIKTLVGLQWSELHGRESPSLGPGGLP